MTTCDTVSTEYGSDDGMFGIYRIIEGVENLEQYQPGGYHPVKLGELFKNGRYEVVHKLGHGGYSTTWLARDNRLEKYVAIKILIAGVEEDNNNEKKIGKRLSSRFSSDPRARQLLSILLDTFTVFGPNGTHKCLVMEPGRMSLSKATEDCPVDDSGRSFPFPTHRAVMGQVIQAVAKLHEAGIVHGDLHFGNILFHLPENINKMSIQELYNRFGRPYTERVKRCDKGELSDSVPKEVVYPVWLGAGPHNIAVNEAGIFLCDFGESYLPVETQRHHTNTLKLNRPPEARFSDDPLSFPSDIWTLGCLLFKIIGIGPLFRTFFERDDDITAQHVEACGKLPEEWWLKWKARDQYFEDDGTYCGPDGEPESLEARFEYGCQDCREMFGEELIGEEEKNDFLDALRKIMVLEPNQRPTIQEIMQMDWYLKWIVPAMEKVENSSIQSGTEVLNMYDDSEDDDSDSTLVDMVAPQKLGRRIRWTKSLLAMCQSFRLYFDKV